MPGLRFMACCIPRATVSDTRQRRYTRPPRFSNRLNRVSAAAAAVFALCASGAYAATPSHPADRETVTTASPQFAVLVNGTTETDGQPMDSNVVVTVAGAGSCAAVFNAPTSTATCTLTAPLASGPYSWSFTWAHHVCVKTACQTTPETSSVFHFTVALPGQTTTTTTTVATTTPSPAKPPLELLLRGRNVTQAGGPIGAAVCSPVVKHKATCVARVMARLFKIRVTTAPTLKIRWVGWVA